VLRAYADLIHELHVQPAAAVACFLLQFFDRDRSLGCDQPVDTKFEDQVAAVAHELLDKELLHRLYFSRRRSYVGYLFLQPFTGEAYDFIELNDIIFNVTEVELKKTVGPFRIELYPYGFGKNVLLRIDIQGDIHDPREVDAPLFGSNLLPVERR